jgi:tetratricopeptide (TPR) repeat protein
MKHPGEERLMAHVETLDPEVAEHVRFCGPCARIVTEFRELALALTDSTAWPQQSSGSLPFDPNAEFEDESSAEVLLENLKDAPVAAWRERFPRRSGSARTLLRHAHSLLEADPQRAQAIADLALVLITDIPDEQERHYLRGWAHRERANALRYLGQLPEALQALDRAAEFFGKLPTGDFDLGTLLYIRATVLREQGHFPEARNAAQQAERIFAEFGDTVRQTHARLALANIANNEGDLETARAEYVRLLASPAIGDDELLLTRVRHNLGCTLHEMHDPEGAREHLTQAMRTYSKLGLETEVARMRWNLARVTMMDGPSSTAQLELEEAIDQLTAHGMRSDAALARLDIAELLLGDDDADAARTHCVAAIDDLLAAGMNVRAATAMALLRDAAATDQITVAVVRHTRSMIEQLHR